MSTVADDAARPVLEIAEIDVAVEAAAAFEAAVAEAIPLFLRARGCRGARLGRSLEHPERYRLMVVWERIENHTVDFRGSEDFQRWRALAGPFFRAPPRVEHVVTVAGEDPSAGAEG